MEVITGRAHWDFTRTSGNDIGFTDKTRQISLKNSPVTSELLPRVSMERSLVKSWNERDAKKLVDVYNGHFHE